jgi:hypothetical protein
MGVIEPFAVPEFFVEAFSEYQVKNGVLTCVGYRTMSDHQVAVVRVVMPVAGLMETIDRATQAAQETRLTVLMS